MHKPYEKLEILVLNLLLEVLFETGEEAGGAFDNVRELYTRMPAADLWTGMSVYLEKVRAPFRVYECNPSRKAK